MSSLQDFMTAGHRHCDDSYSNAENAVAANDWDSAAPAWDRFANDLEHHLQQEEQILFPAFEERTGNTQGPTEVMRMEHQQMRALVQELNQAVQAQDGEQFLGLSETLMILMQQHNMKEEQILYPMTDQVVNDTDALLNRLKSL